MNIEQNITVRLKFNLDCIQSEKIIKGITINIHCCSQDILIEFRPIKRNGPLILCSYFYSLRIFLQSKDPMWHHFLFLFLTHPKLIMIGVYVALNLLIMSTLKNK